MKNKEKLVRSNEQVSSIRGDFFLEKIPDGVYDQMVAFLSEEYHFMNGIENAGKMRLADYFLGIKKETANLFLDFIEQTMSDSKTNHFPVAEMVEGFNGCFENLLPSEQEGDFSFGYFDAAITKEGLRIIEIEACTTYPITAAKTSQLLREKLSMQGSSTFVNEPEASFQSLIDLLEEVIVGEEKEGIVLTDRAIQTQKTNFEFYATQKELKQAIDIVDSSLIFEKEGQLFYRLSPNEAIKPLKRLYNRVLPLEAIDEDNYPYDTQKWQFRFDKAYKGMKFVNHPSHTISTSKRLLPYLSHPFNPSCYELSLVAEAFKCGEKLYSDYVWKHKLGAAGRNIFLLPNDEILSELTASHTLNDYIVQKKVDFEAFYTADGEEKIVEVRFITIQSLDKLLVVPMARIGHIRKNENGEISYHIHFGQNNKAGYGFCPVVIFDT